VAQDGGVTASEDGRHVCAVEPQGSIAHAIHATVYPAQAPHRQPMMDGMSAHAGIEKLFSRNHAVLALRELRNRQVGMLSLFLR
jgi:hypothetical protein